MTKKGRATGGSLHPLFGRTRRVHRASDSPSDEADDQVSRTSEYEELGAGPDSRPEITDNPHQCALLDALRRSVIHDEDHRTHDRNRVVGPEKHRSCVPANPEPVHGALCVGTAGFNRIHISPLEGERV